MPAPKHTGGTPLNLIHHQIYRVIYGDKHEVIGGIEIDFRHPKSAEKDWEAPPGLFEINDIGEDGPSLSFPWFERSEENFDKSALPTRANDKLSESSPSYILERGDKLYIRKIETVPTDNQLLLGCNPDRALVYVNIQKLGANLIEVERPIVMKPRNELWEREFTGNYFASVAGRLMNYFNIRNLVSMKGIPDDGSFAYRALRKLLVINRINPLANGQKSGIVLPTVPEEEYHDNSSIWFTVNDAVALGYLWAKSEDQRNFLTISAKTITDKQAAAGRKSGQSRLKRKEDKFKIAKAIADDFLATRKKSPTQAEIVDYVDSYDRWAASWKRLGLPSIPKPARRGIEDIVSERFGSRARSAPKSAQ